MSEAQDRRTVVALWMGKADQALAAARRELAAGDGGLATNRIYYACFYAAMAVLLQENMQFSSHAGVRAAVHQHLVKCGRLPASMGKFHDQAFEDRQEADYVALAKFDTEVIRSRIDEAQRYVAYMKRLLHDE